MSEHFLTQLHHQFGQRTSSDPLAALREKSWQQFLERGLPDKSHEAYRYVSLKELYSSRFEFDKTATIDKIDKSAFEHEIIAECKHSHLVFVDGRLALELSDISALPKQVVLLPLQEAFRTHASFLQHHLARSLKEETDPFTMINQALHSEGLFFFLPPKIHVAVPVQCLHVVTGENPQASLSRVCLTLGAQSHLQWITSYHAFQPNVRHLVLPATEISLEDGAHLNFLNDQGALFSAWHFESLRATLKKNARFDCLNITFGAKAVRQSYRVQLKGEHAQAHLNGLWMLNQNRTAHTHVIVDHEAPHTHSLQLFKGVLNDASQSSFEGKILVRQAAQKTEAYQLNKNLILSQGAIANSKPNLEVFADDVKASHGATVSQLEEEQLFYLSTRGIDAVTAKGLLVRAFCQEMIAKIPYSSILEKMQRLEVLGERN